MADTYLPNRAGDQQRKLDELVAENTRLLDCGAMATGIDCTLDTGCVACLTAEAAARERENTPLRDALRSAADALQSEANRQERLAAGAVPGSVSRSVHGDIGRMLIVLCLKLRDAIPPESPTPAVTGTTSDSAPLDRHLPKVTE